MRRGKRHLASGSRWILAADLTHNRYFIALPSELRCEFKPRHSRARGFSLRDSAHRAAALEKCTSKRTFESEGYVVCMIAEGEEPHTTRRSRRQPGQCADLSSTVSIPSPRHSFGGTTISVSRSWQTLGRHHRGFLLAERAHNPAHGPMLDAGLGASSRQPETPKSFAELQIG